MISNWGNVAMVLSGLALVLSVFGCVVLHELGHALAARKFGIATRDITLYPIGGVARLERMSDNPWEELCIALAGPVVNAGLAALFLVLAGVAYLVWNAAGGVMTTSVLEGNAFSWGFTIVSFLFMLTMANVMLGVFNLLPAFPMDGGRVLRAVLAMILPRLRATEIAATIGSVLALALGLLGIITWTPMLFLLAAFVFLAGRQELMVLRYKDLARDTPNSSPSEPEAERGDVNPVPPTAIPEHFTGILWDTRARVWVVWKDGRPIETIGRRQE